MSHAVSSIRSIGHPEPEATAFQREISASLAGAGTDVYFRHDVIMCRGCGGIHEADVSDDVPQMVRPVLLEDETGRWVIRVMTGVELSRMAGMQTHNIPFIYTGIAIRA